MGAGMETVKGMTLEPELEAMTTLERVCSKDDTVELIKVDYDPELEKRQTLMNEKHIALAHEQHLQEESRQDLNKAIDNLISTAKKPTERCGEAATG